MEKTNDIVPRQYQNEILEEAKQRNVIAFIDTGSGKTLISFMLVKEVIGQCVFLAPTVQLVEQQAKAAEEAGITSKGFVGKTTDDWDENRWNEASDKVRLLVFTPQTFVNYLSAGYGRINQFVLIILDECHHWHGNSPYARLMREFYHPLDRRERPKLFGLTASPITNSNTNSSDLKYQVQEFCDMMDWSFARFDREVLAQFANNPTMKFLEFPNIRPDTSGIEVIKKELLMNYGQESDLINLLSVLENRGEVLYKKIGKLAFSHLLQDLSARKEMVPYKGTLNAYIDLNWSISQRTQSLIDFIKTHLSSSNDSRIIIFAERRVTVWYLQKILHLVIPDQVEAIIGCGLTVNNVLNTVKQSDTDRRTLMNNYRQGNFRVLVATSVVEEGIDIPACDIVIKFDSFSQNLRSYVQAKGRARAQESLFAVLCKESKKKDLQKRVSDYERAVEFLKQLSEMNIQPSPRRFPVSQMYYVERTGARVVAEACLQFVKDICKQIYWPWKFDEKIPNGPLKLQQYPPHAFKNVSNPEKGGYLAVITLPNRDPIHGKKLKRTSKAAQDEGMLAVVQTWHDEGLLTDHLKLNTVPIAVQNMLKELTEEEKETIKGEKDKILFKTNKLKTVLGSTAAPAGSVFYLYELQTLPAGMNHGIGLILPVKLPEFRFKIFPGNLTRHQGVTNWPDQHTVYDYPDLNTPDYWYRCNDFGIWVFPVLLDSREFKSQELDSIMAFQNLLHVVAAHNTELVFNKTDMYSAMIVPILNEHVNWNMVMDSRQYSAREEAGILKNDVIDASTAMYSTVEAVHNRDKYVILKLQNYGIRSEFEERNKLISVKDYFQEKYNITLEPQEVYEWIPLANYKQVDRPVFRKSQQTEVQYPLLPVTVLRHFPISYAILSFTRCLPSILRRIDLHLVMCELGLPIKINLLFASLTWQSALDIDDYQRLETLGDTVLKFLMSEALFHQNERQNEDLLSKLRSQAVSNDYLCILAMKKKIFHYLNAQHIQISTWSPPGYPNFQNKNYTSATKPLAYRVSAKQFSDVVEALIGAAYISGGFESSRTVMLYFGQDVNFEPSYAKMIDMDEFDIGTLENRIGHQFINPTWALEAMTHPASNPSFNYQRLEFLGDAILDMIIMEFLYAKFPQASPGALSELKKQTVMNATLKKASERLGLVGLMSAKGLQRHVSDDKVCGDLFESLLGALYLDGEENGYEIAKGFALRHLSDLIPDTYSKLPDQIYHEYVQQNHLGRVSCESKLMGDRVQVIVYLDGELQAKGIGDTKREARDEAFQRAYDTFNK